MIKVVKEIDLRLENFFNTGFSSSRIYSFTVFQNSKGQNLSFLSVHISGAVRDESLVVDLESGLVIKKLKFDFKWFVDLFVYIPKLHCLVGVKKHSLFLVYFDEDWRVESDNMRGDVYESLSGICRYDDSKLVLLSQKKPGLAIFYDLEKKTDIGTWRNEEEKFDSVERYNTGVICSESKSPKYVFISSIKKFGGGYAIDVIDSIKHESIFRYWKDIEAKDLFFDYSRRFDLCYRQDIESKEKEIFRDNIMMHSFEDETIRSEKIEKKNNKGELVIFQPRYAIGDSFFLGTDDSNNRVVTREGKGRYTNLANFSSHAGFDFLNHGRDIFVLYLTRKKVKFLHLENTELLDFKNDPDEKERIEYLSNLSLENYIGVELFKIGIGFSSFFCSKLLIISL